jgi:hypothetical protein
MVVTPGATEQTVKICAKVIYWDFIEYPDYFIITVKP